MKIHCLKNGPSARHYLRRHTKFRSPEKMEPSMNRFFSLLALLFSASLALSQTPAPAVQETEKLMSLGSRPALRVEFLHSKTGKIEDAWVAFLKNELGSKPKYSKKTKEWLAANAKAPIFGGESPVDFYAKMEASGDDVNFTLWIDSGADQFISSKKEESEKWAEANALAKRFIKSVRLQTVQDELLAQTDRLRDLENRLKKLQRQHESLNKDIENWKMKIAKAEEDLKTNDADQAKTTLEIETQTKTVDAVQARLGEVEKEN